MQYQDMNSGKAEGETKETGTGALKTLMRAGFLVKLFSVGLRQRSATQQNYVMSHHAGTWQQTTNFVLRLESTVCTVCSPVVYLWNLLK